VTPANGLKTHHLFGQARISLVLQLRENARAKEDLQSIGKTIDNKWQSVAHLCLNSLWKIHFS